MIVLKQLLKVRKFPLRESLLHVPENWQLVIDSLITIAYNSDDQRIQAEKEPDLYAPANSMQSIEIIDLEASSDEEVKV